MPHSPGTGPLQVVFHIEPGRAFRHAWFIPACAIARRLEATGEFRTRIVIGAEHAAAAADVAETHGFAPNLRLLDTGFLTGTLGLDPDALLARHAFPVPGDPVVAWLAGVLRDLLAEEAPALLVTGTPHGAYRAAFGALPTLFLEVGPFARPPFAASFYLDPAGPGCLDVLAAVPDAPARLPFDPATDAALSAVQAAARRHAREASPYGALTDELRGRFRKLVLLPLHGETGPVFRRRTPIRGHVELAWTVASALPPDVGVLALQHPLVGAELALPELPPNLVTLPRLHWSVGGADYLAPLVDGLVTVDSKAAFAGLLHDIPVLTLGEGVFPAFAAGPEALPGGAFLDHPAGMPAHRRLLAWLLTCLAPPERVLFDSNWVPELCHRFIAGNGRPEAGLPAAYGDPATILGDLAQSVLRHPPPQAAGKPLAKTPALADAWPSRKLELGTPALLAGKAIAARLTAPPTDALLLLSGGWAEFPPVPALLGFEAEIEVGQTAAEWVPLLWAGDPGRPWQRGRSFCLSLLAPQGQLLLVAGGPGLPQMMCWTRPGVLPPGTSRQVSAAVLPAQRRLGIVVDGVVEGLEPFTDGPLWPAKALLMGQDAHFRGPGIHARYRAPRVLLG